MKLSSLRWLSLLSALAAGLCLAAPAAHALPPEYLVGLALHPTDPAVMVLRFDSGGGGLLYTRDGGKSFRAAPARPFYKYGLINRVPIELGNDGKLLVGLGDGLLIDDAAGCVSSEPLVKSWVADMAPHPSDPDALFFVTTGMAQGVHAGLWKRDKAGALTSFGLSEPLAAGMAGVVVSGLKVVKRAASSEGLRFVETGTRYTLSGTNMVPSPFFRFSDDLGATWTEHPIPDPGKTSGVARLLAVDAAEPMKVVVSLEVTGPDPEPKDPILFSLDAGQTFTAYAGLDLQIAKPIAALLLPTGQFFIGERDQGGGLWTADMIGATPRKVGDYPVHCLGYQPKNSTMYLCKAYEFGVFDPAAMSFCGMFQLNQTLGLSCPSLTATQLSDAQSQLCNAWCGPGHYASSPLCSMYDNPAQRCGVQARAYDTQDPDPSKHWIEPPGSFASTRCKGFELPQDAGVPGAESDAGSAASDAGTQAIDHDAVHGSHDSGASDEEPKEDAGTADAGKDENKKPGGCQLSAEAPRSVPTEWLILALMLASLFARSASKRARG